MSSRSAAMNRQYVQRLGALEYRRVTTYIDCESISRAKHVTLEKYGPTDLSVGVWFGLAGRVGARRGRAWPGR
jgi:hypothetical protein